MKIRTEYVATNSKDVIRHIMSGKWHSRYRAMKTLAIISGILNLFLFILLCVEYAK